MNDVTTNLILITAMLLMAVGVYQDIKIRKYPNSILVSIIFLGVIFSLVKCTLPGALLGFILFNIFGIFMHKYHMLSAGDSKFISTLFLFINVLNIKDGIILIIFLLLFGGLFGVYYYKRKFKSQQAKEKVVNEFKSMRNLVVYRINSFKRVNEFDYSDMETLKKTTMPFTLPIYIAFVATQIALLFV